MSSMNAVPAGTSGATAANQRPEGVAGRIVSSHSPLNQLVGRWLDNMRARGKKPRSIQAYREVVERAIRECGWTTAADLTAANLTGWLEGRRLDLKWKGSTYNRNMQIFRGLTRYCELMQELAEDPLKASIRAEDDSGDGARAATLDEARRIIFAAWLRDRTDARSSRPGGNRALYWMCLFAAGARLNEPSQWLLKDVRVRGEHPVPHIAWSREVQKNHKRRYIAITQELAGLLRAHIRTLEALRAANGEPPLGPDDRIFPVVPSSHSFRSDRDRAGVAALDYRDRAISPHSARKYFETQLPAAGVEPKMVNFLMRHVIGVDDRYFDPTLEAQAQALAGMPRLWPPQDPENRANVDNSPLDLTSGPRGAQDVAGTSTDPVTTGPPTNSALASRSKCQRDPVRAELAGGVGHDGACGPATKPGDGAGIEPGRYEPRNRHFRTVAAPPEMASPASPIDVHRGSLADVVVRGLPSIPG
jgi:integrase